VVISHDRWFLDRIATHILAFEGDSETVWFEGNYGAYKVCSTASCMRFAQQHGPAHVPHRPLGGSMSRPHSRFAPLVLAVMLVTAACGDRGTTGPGTSQAKENTLVFTRADQSRLVFAAGSQLRVWCGPWEDGAIATPAVHLVFLGPGASDRGWMLTAVRADVRIGVPLAFPNRFIFDQPRNVDLFILDEPNELSTSTSGSSGSITFQQLDCATGGRVEFTIVATVASELNGRPSVSVAGRVNAPVGAAPR
jgi:hypothetical protein